MKVIISKQVCKFLNNFKNDKDLFKIQLFLDDLKNSENPTKMTNCKKLEGFENEWRWRVGKYRIKATISKENEVKIVYIYDISKRDDKTYK